MKLLSKDSIIHISERLPALGHRVIVICRNFRCLGYLDAKGVWRGNFKDDEIENVVGWVELS